MENTIKEPVSDKEIIKEIQARVEAKGNPYANRKGQAILKRMIKEKKLEQEMAKQEYQQNPEIRKMYAELKEKQKIADGRQQQYSAIPLSPHIC